jgi:hypothetical protein
MNRIRKEIPTDIKSMRASLYSTIVLKNENTTLTVYQGKPSKNVLMLSTLHKSVSCSDNRKKLPESVEYYNKTKYGVDALDKKARLYTTKVASRRWPLQVFYNILDIAAINAVIVYNEVLGKRMTRRAFILKLIEELHDETKEDNTEDDLEDSDQLNDDDDDTTPSLKPTRSNCAINCSKRSRNKTTKVCKKCKRPVCGKCIAMKKEFYICKLCKTNVLE